MAEIKIPIKIDGFQCVEEMVQTVLNYTYKGRTLKEWADSISEPQTNADRIRAMTDKELAMWIALKIECLWCPAKPQEGKCMPRLNPKMDCIDAVLDWLKQKVKDED